MKNNRFESFYKILLTVFFLLYLYLEFAMLHAKGGTGLGFYLIYFGVLFVHCIFLVASYLIRKLKNKRDRNDKYLFDKLNIVLVIFLVFRLLVFV